MDTAHRLVTVSTVPRRTQKGVYAAWVAALAAVTWVLSAGCTRSYDWVANLNSTGSGIICLGDSITRGYGASPGADYPARLSQILGVPVVNAGRNGDTTGSALRRLPGVLEGRTPQVIVIELGGNDYLEHVPREETLKNLDQIVSKCVEVGAIPVLVHAKFGLFSDPYLAGYEDIARRHGAVLVKDALSGILGHPARMSDQIHPNDKGYALLAKRIAEAIRPVLSAAEARARPPN